MGKVKVLSRKELSKKYKSSGTADEFIPSENTPWLPSRILSLNYALGGGIPYGRIVEIFGLESSGKSLLAYEFAWCAQYLGGAVVWSDAESCYMNSWAEKNGIDSSRVEMNNSNIIENITDHGIDTCLMLRSELTDNQPILWVIDSLASTEVQDSSDQAMTGRKAEMGNRAKAWDTFYRRRTEFLSKYGIILIIINQVRTKLGASPFEDNQTTPGGKATAFYSSIRLNIVKSKMIKGKKSKGKFVEDKSGKKVGQHVIIQIRKNKVAPPHDSIRTRVIYTDWADLEVGYEKYDGLEQLAIENDVITKSGNTYYLGDKKIGVGITQVTEAIAESSKLRRALIKKLRINSLSRLEKRLSNIDHNLYPVEV